VIPAANYRLFQDVDLVYTIKLTELKILDKSNMNEIQKNQYNKFEKR